MNLKTKQDHLKFLRSLAVRVERLHSPEQAALILDGHQGFNAEFGGNTGIRGMIENLEQGDDKERFTGWQEKLKAARAGDTVAKAEISKIRTITTMNYLRAFSKWLGFFSEQNRAANEVIYWENESRQDVKIAYSGQDGRPRLSQILKLRQRQFVEMKLLTSEEFEYPLIDMYRGRVSDEIKGLIDIASEMDEQVSQFLRPFVDGAIGAFAGANTGKRSNRAFVLHPTLLKAGNIPETNLLDASVGGKFGKATLDAIINYQAAWADVLGKQPLRVKAVQVPSKDSRGILSDITLTSFQNALSEQVMTEGALMDYGGEHFTLMPDATLNYADGFAYVQFDRPLGEVIFTPELDQTVDDDKTKARENKGTIYAQKAIGAVVPTPNYPFVLKVKYK